MHRTTARHLHCLLAGLGGLLLAAGAARAEDDFPGFYVGAALGQSSIGANQTGIVSGSGNLQSYSATNAAWAVRAGIRPLHLLGAEFEYADLGSPSVNIGSLARVDMAMKGPGLYALLFLPVPVLDVYAKGGIARISSRARLTALSCTPTPGCVLPAPVTATQSDTSGAIGVGLQFKLGLVALRGEYLRYSAAGTNPWLGSAGLSWSF